MNAMIFNIQKFSLHDGPGIRTTVFFKGCNLRCSWCANPESQKMLPQMTLDAAKCTGCGVCVATCANYARKMQRGRPVVDGGKCGVCDTCMQNCPAQAIGREGRAATLDEILDEVMKDKPFYDQSGGGVTFSGGEVLLQQEFATELARALHERGVSVAIETAAAVPSRRFAAFLNEIDYAFVDLKHYDDERHRAGTGMGNAQVVQNIRSLRESGLPYTIRIPVIPGYNDAPADAHGFAKLLRELGIGRVELLPFHQLGERKYSLLGREYAHAGQNQLHSEDLKQFQKILIEQGIEAKV